MSFPLTFPTLERTENSREQAQVPPPPAAQTRAAAVRGAAPWDPRALSPCPWSPCPPRSRLFSLHQLKSAPTQGQPCEEDQRSLGTPPLTWRVEKGFLEEVTVQGLKGWAARLDG